MINPLAGVEAAVLLVEGIDDAVAAGLAVDFAIGLAVDLLDLGGTHDDGPRGSCCCGKGFLVVVWWWVDVASKAGQSESSTIFRIQEKSEKKREREGDER